MAKTCSACHQTYSDDLKQCPHCAVRDANDPSNLDRRSSGEFFLDAPGTDLAKHGEIVTRGPEESDEIVEIDWAAIEEEGGEHSSVVDLDKDAYVEVELPSGIDPAKNQPRRDQPSSAEIELPPIPEIVRDNPAASVPMAKKLEPSATTPPLAARATDPGSEKPEVGGKATKVLAGQRPPTQLAKSDQAARIAPPLDSAANLSEDPPLASPARAASGEQPTSFTLGKPASANADPSTPVDWNDEELIEIEPDAAGDESSMVDLGSGPHRRPATGGPSSAPLSPPPKSLAQDLDEAAEELFAESSAVDLGSSQEVNVPSAAISGVALHRHGSAPDIEPSILEEPEAIALDEEVSPRRAKKRGSGLGMLATGVGGVAVGAVACVGLWYAGLFLPESLRPGNDNKPIAPSQHNASAANLEPRKNGDEAKKPEVAAAPASKDDGKAQAVLTALQSKLAESKYLSDEQPDPIKAVEQLLRDSAVAKNPAPAPKTSNGSLDAAIKALQAEKYLGPDQTDVAAGIAKLAKDKKAIEEQFTKAVADRKTAADKLTKALEDAKAAEETAKLATEESKTAAAKLKDLETQSKTSTDKIKDLTAQAKAAEDKARAAADALNAANDKTQAALQQAGVANATVKAIAAKLATANIVKPDAGADDLVKAVDQVVRLAKQPQPATTTAPVTAITAPTPAPAPKPAPAVISVAETEFRHDPIRAERYFGRGLSQFWDRQYAAAEGEFAEASRLAGPAAQDARFLYFQGLAELAQGKTQQANATFTDAGRLERSNRPGPAAVNASLERVQGGARQYLEAFRR